MQRFGMALAAAVLFAAPASAASLKVATWNIEHLRDGIGEGNNPRTQTDFDRLRGYADVLDADVIAFQEIENLAAAQRVFSPAKYQIFIEERNDTQRNGFAVRNGLPVVRHLDVSALNVTGDLRHGVDITVTVGSTDLRLLSVHLKSFCFDKRLTTSTDACRKLNLQVSILEVWIDARAAEETPFIVLGDFNRRFDALDDDFWQEIDDGEPANADLARITQGETALCWDRQYPRFIDHIVFGRQVARWIKPHSFEEIVYQESNALKEQLSDH